MCLLMFLCILLSSCCIPDSKASTQVFGCSPAAFTEFRDIPEPKNITHRLRAISFIRLFGHDIFICGNIIYDTLANIFNNQFEFRDFLEMCSYNSILAL